MTPITSMGQMDCSMVESARLRSLVCLLSIAVSMWATAGCGDNAGAEGDIAASSGETRILGAKETRRLLRELPYRYEFSSVATPEGAESAVAGRVMGRHRTIVNFGIALGHGHKAIPVPRAGTRYSYGYPRSGFIFTSDLLIERSDGSLAPNPQLRTAAQQNEASEITVSMTDKLCLAATGDHCPP
jgi:hypothetical protein